MESAGMEGVCDTLDEDLATKSLFCRAFPAWLVLEAAKDAATRVYAYAPTGAEVMVSHA